MECAPSLGGQTLRASRLTRHRNPAKLLSSFSGPLQPLSSTSLNPEGVGSWASGRDCRSAPGWTKREG